MTKWGLVVAREFDGADFGDLRLTKRCKSIAAALADRPDQSIPNACIQSSETKGAYRFLSNESIDLASILEPHIQQTLDRCRGGVVLAIQDTTYLNFTAHKATKGLGQIGTHETLRGMAVHTAIAVLPSGDVQGLLAQEVWVRTKRMPKVEDTRERRNRPRESERWGRMVETISGQEHSARIVHVMDREADIYEVLEKLTGIGQSYVIRASQDRRVEGEESRLFELCRSGQELGTFELRVPGKPGRLERLAHLTIRAISATLRPPQGMASQNIEAGVVLVTETEPPAGASRIEWMLLTREPHGTREECLRVVGYYAKRWTIEDFHMVLKTGCRVEERQLQSREALEAFLGLAGVISVMLLRLRYLARSGTEQPASVALSARQLLILTKLFPKLSTTPTAQEALRAVAKRGGFMGRKSDGNPGWRTLWRGMRDLLILEEGFALASSLPR